MSSATNFKWFSLGFNQKQELQYSPRLPYTNIKTNMCEDFFSYSIEYRVIKSEYRVKKVEYRVIKVEYRVIKVDYRVIKVEYRVIKVEY